MGRLVDLDDLVSAGIVVARLGWKRIQRLHTARERYGFPDPVKTVSRTSLWLWPDVRAWALTKGWVLWPGPPGAEKIMIEPENLVDPQAVAERLGLALDAEDLAVTGLPVVTSPTDRTGPMHRWSAAERLWHDRANRRSTQHASDPAEVL